MSGRIQAARQRAADSKRRLGIFAVAAFVATFGLAAASHGGSSTSGDHATAVEQPTTPEADTGTFDFGSPDVAPATGEPPQLQTQTS
jgi:hypothetical protein